MSKAKLKRNVVGSVCKAKEPGRPDYIKMRDGKIYRLESAAQQLKSAEEAHAAGKFDAGMLDLIKERINKIPSWVRFEMVELVEKD